MQAEKLKVIIEYVPGHPKGAGWYYSIQETLPGNAYVTHDVVGPFATTREAVNNLHARCQPTAGCR